MSGYGVPAYSRLSKSDDCTVALPPLEVDLGPVQPIEPQGGPNDAASSCRSHGNRYV